MSSATRRGAAAALRADYDAQLQARKITPDADQQAALARFERLTAQLAASPSPGRLRRALARRFPRQLPLQRPRGLYLWGSVGRGKTWLMDLFFAGQPAASSRRCHFHHFMRDVHTRLSALSGVERPLDTVAAQLADEAGLLCIDEFFVADIGDAMILHALLAALLREGVVLVFTSNLPPAALYRDGLQRERFLPAIELLSTHLEVLELQGHTDYRLRHLQGGGTYQLGSGRDADAALDALFEALAPPRESPHEGAPDTLLIEGRAIAVRRVAQGMAWFTFEALCDGPRSANDYIEIANSLHTVFISGIPVLDATQDDAARRFIALVDEFYDRNVKLVIGAAAEPTQLYRGERLRFAFERTASRLIEMRSQDYLGREHRSHSRTATQAQNT